MNVLGKARAYPSRRQKPVSSTLIFWIPAFARMTILHLISAPLCFLRQHTVNA
jgi:hypothetical protein